MCTERCTSSSVRPPCSNGCARTFILCANCLIFTRPAVEQKPLAQHFIIYIPLITKYTPYPEQRTLPVFFSLIIRIHPPALTYPANLLRRKMAAPFCKIRIGPPPHATGCHGRPGTHPTIKTCFSIHLIGNKPPFNPLWSRNPQLTAQSEKTDAPLSPHGNCDEHLDFPLCLTPIFQTRAASAPRHWP